MYIPGGDTARGSSDESRGPRRLGGDLYVHLPTGRHSAENLVRGDKFALSVPVDYGALAQSDARRAYFVK